MFPPKTSDTFDVIKGAIEQIASLNPSFMSVTYGAGGGTSDFTVSLAKDVHDKLEAYYVNATDFDVINEISEKIISRI